MKHTFTLLLFLPLLLFGQTKRSDQATISLLTCGPGQDLYAAFGHSAIRVKDPVRSIDKVYNYGTFDFDTPNFYLKFIRGQLDYKLGTGKFERFKASYVRDGRFMKEEILLLSKQQKVALVDFLEENAKPENAYYRYDFFYDNCATRIRDVLQKVLADSLILVPQNQEDNPTYRQLLQPYIENMPWVDYGIDLALGLPTDAEADFYGQMFLPDFLREGLLQGKLIDGKETRPLLGPSKTLLEAAENGSFPPIWSRPVFLFLLLLLVMAAAAVLRPTSKVVLLAERILMVLAGIAGLILLFLMFGTEHVATARNLNIIWANPLFLVLVFWPKAEWKRKLQMGLFVLLLVFLGSWWVLPQGFHMAVILFSASLVFMLYRSLKSR